MSSYPPDLVSVLMPVLDEEASVRGAVASALSQTHPHVEVLVIDGGSRDATADAVAELAALDPRVRLLHNPRRSIPAGLNTGLRYARGSVVARIDAHASVNRTYIERGVAALQADPGLAGVGGRRVGVARTRTGRSIAMALSSRFGIGDSLNHYGDTACETDHASFGVYRADAARAVGGWDERLPVNEDVDFDFRLRALGFRIAYDPEMVIRWHVRESVRDLGRQYRRYGRGKAAMVRKNGRSAVRARHLAAPALVAELGLAGLALGRGRPRVAAALTLPYALGLTAASLGSWRVAREAGQAEETNAWALPAAFAVMHTGWGVGFLEGLAGRTPHQTSARPTRRPTAAPRAPREPAVAH